MVAQTVKNLPAMWGLRFNPWRRKWQSTPVLLSGEFHRQRSLVGYSPWSHKESDTTEWLTLSFFFDAYTMLKQGWCWHLGPEPMLLTVNQWALCRPGGSWGPHSQKKSLYFYICHWFQSEIPNSAILWRLCVTKWNVVRGQKGGAGTLRDSICFQDYGPSCSRTMGWPQHNCNDPAILGWEKHEWEHKLNIYSFPLVCFLTPGLSKLWDIDQLI